MTDALQWALVSVRSNFAGSIKLAVPELLPGILKRDLEFAFARIAKNHLALGQKTGLDLWRRTTLIDPWADSDEPLLSPGHLNE